MARYTQESIEGLRDAVDMVALVSKETDLRRVGTRWTGLCPFHEERTPSFSVNAEEKLFHCFGCGKGGDSIGFVMETENLGFPEAVEALAERFGVELKREREDPQEEERRKRRERLLALLERTAGFYAAFLWEAPEARRARDYLAGRGLGEEVLRDFRVGYAPKAWDRVLTGARRGGYTEAELLASGLAARARNGNVLDRFRERIMFPLADSRGRVLGFGARAMRDEQGAKYINTSENEIYKKGRQLFGIDRARPAIAKAGHAVVVEGYTDVLALHGAGVQEAVGIMGTAVTQEQVAELARNVGSDGQVFMALDADRSGQEAMLRAARIARERQVQLRVVRLPEGSDPADLVAADGASAIASRLTHSLSVLEFEVGRVLEDADLDSAEGADRALVAVRALIATAPPRSKVRDSLVRMAADRLDVPVDYLSSAVEAPPESVPERRPQGPSAGQTERRFLANSLAAGAAGRDALDWLTPEHLGSGVMRRARDHIAANFEDPLGSITPGEDDELASLLHEITSLADEPLGREELRLDFLQLEQSRLQREVDRARGAEDPRQSELAAALQKVRTELRTSMGQAT